MQYFTNMGSPMKLTRSNSRKTPVAYRQAAATSPRVKPFAYGLELGATPTSNRYANAKVPSTTANTEQFSEEDISLISPIHMQKSRSIRRDHSNSERYAYSAQMFRNHNNEDFLINEEPTFKQDFAVP